MAPALPLIFGAAALLVLGKKKKRRKVGSGEPDRAPGSGGGPAGDAVYDAKRVSVLVWNSEIAARARGLMTAQWESSDRVLSGGKFFVLMRNTAMRMWPYVKWPITINDEIKMVEIAPGNRIPRWVYNLGDAGPTAWQIWLNLRSLAWDITGYKPPV